MNIVFLYEFIFFILCSLESFVKLLKEKQSYENHKKLNFNSLSFFEMILKKKKKSYQIYIHMK